VTDAAVFEEYRGLMFAVAYRMLGTIADAEDAVQDAWLRWSAASRADVADPRAYLVRIITNTALNRLRAVRARREAYIGPWLPEPLLTEAGPDAAERAELAESVSVAMLVVLESLTPDERAVSCCTRCSASASPRSPWHSAGPLPRCASSRTARGSTSRRAGRGLTWTGTSSVRSPRGFSPRPRAGTSRTS
jgi:RNA polymerase sigma factor (sigma-70 family)